MMHVVRRHPHRRAGRDDPRLPPALIPIDERLGLRHARQARHDAVAEAQAFTHAGGEVRELLEGCPGREGGGAGAGGVVGDGGEEFGAEAGEGVGRGEEVDEVGCEACGVCW